MGHGSWVMGHGSWVMGHGSWVIGETVENDQSPFDHRTNSVRRKIKALSRVSGVGCKVNQLCGEMLQSLTTPHTLHPIPSLNEQLWCLSPGPLSRLKWIANFLLGFSVGSINALDVVPVEENSGNF